MEQMSVITQIPHADILELAPLSTGKMRGGITNYT
jgi:hypothetical protein